MKLRRLRDDDVLENGDIVLIRGGDLEDGVQRLVSCPHQVMPNIYHDA